MGTVTHSLVVEYIPGFVANFSQIYIDLPARQHFLFFMEDLALSTSSHKFKRKKGLFIACIVTRHKKRMAKGCFDVQKSNFCERL